MPRAGSLTSMWSCHNLSVIDSLLINALATALITVLAIEFRLYLKLSPIQNASGRSI